MNSLEALNELCDLATPNGTCLNYVIGLGIIINKDLERLEVLEKENQELKEELEIDKYKKAIEILKNYIAINDNEVYSFGRSFKPNQQEYELLKEVLE